MELREFYLKTKTDELTIEVKKIRLLTKSLKPMPEKHKGLTDIKNNIQTKVCRFNEQP
ncbi:MAG: hypothetical protein Ct9H90mP22_4640 [Gammaproteobacteria bacterium]|nr:MAG: hypothetical protein Ct9H90mP22_4640 [Gammaproteobacteria bacterium]